MIWSEKTTSFKGLPRPYWFPNSKYYYKFGVRHLHKKVPTPYQSKPGTELTAAIRLNIKNEKEVITNDLCPYCGIQIEESLKSIRWKIEVQDFNQEPNHDWVPSDFRPFHLECMKQARFFCPFMRILDDAQFEIKIQKENLKDAKENFKKFYKIDWEARPRPFEESL